MRIEVVPMEVWHCHEISLRIDDELECAALGLSPSGALRESMETSKYASALLVDGVPAACFGLVPDPRPLFGRQACAWLLTGDLVECAPVAFHRTARRWLIEARSVYPVLWNYVDARYTTSLRWLERLGFRAHPAAPYGPYEMPFHLVTLGL